jgi:hypothetical protein
VSEDVALDSNWMRYNLQVYVQNNDISYRLEVQTLFQIHGPSGRSLCTQQKIER